MPPDRLPSIVNESDKRGPTLLGPDGYPVRASRVERLPERDGTLMAPAPSIHPRGVEPRGYVPFPGQNLLQQPRGVSGTTALSPFPILRAFGEFDLCRIAIEDVKGQVLGMDWNIELRDGLDETPETEADMERAREFVETPDPLADLSFHEWIQRVMEDMLVTDSLTLLPHRSRAGQPLGLEQVDGTTIVPLVDDRGRPPLPPAAAYQQMVRGQPETEFTLTELWYLPVNRRVDTPYGRSPLEQVLLTVNLALRNALSDLAFYTDGTLPESLFVFPETWTAAQILEYQQTWNDILSGNDAARVGGMRMMPFGTYIPTKDRPFNYDFLEWLGRVIAWSFGVSPLPIAKMQNRAVAEQQELSSLESGARPRAKFIANIINRYIRRELNIQTVVFTWGTDETEDPSVTIARDSAHASIGAVTLDEIRESVGRKPYENGLGSEPIVVTPAGPMLLAKALQQSAQQQQQQPDMPAAPPETAGDVPPSTPAPELGAGEEDLVPGALPPEPPSASSSSSASSAEQVTAALMTWKRAAVNRWKKGDWKRAAQFSHDAIPALMKTWVVSRIEAAQSLEDVKTVFDNMAELKKKAVLKASARPSR